MFETDQLFASAQWSGIATIAFAVLTVLAFLFKWGFRFRLVGVTSFMGVLTGAIFALGFGLYTRPSVVDAVHYSRVFDTGASQVVIAVPPDITPTQLEATMRQASLDLFSPGRLGQGNRMTIRVRTITHPQPGVSQPLFLGEVQRSLSTREDEQARYTTYPDALAQLSQPPA
ncbi:Ycf51 family protein [Myxacorys almedinensis]|uniref:DUF2518 family protein n=1 Tax=Myxacorys almedinensis A TaxID=2690445 RepID=A0A8J7Z3C8_9CYAN|nr:Ycf51 family protein [Myxacorys almedinensis]NDJ18984.1 hypothetical protein [Myxacorys almedinensis A]